MSPENADCVQAAAIECCVLGNNHILDWGRRGLLDTLATLEHLKIKTAGAGRNFGEASTPDRALQRGESVPASGQFLAGTRPSTASTAASVIGSSCTRTPIAL